MDEIWVKKIRCKRLEGRWNPLYDWSRSSPTESFQKVLGKRQRCMSACVAWQGVTNVEYSLMPIQQQYHRMSFWPSMFGTLIIPTCSIDDWTINRYIGTYSSTVSLSLTAIINRRLAVPVWPSDGCNIKGRTLPYRIDRVTRITAGQISFFFFQQPWTLSLQLLP